VNSNLDVFSLIANALIVVAAWVTGEAGRVAVASGLGGFARWWNTDRVRIRDGAASAVGGLITGTYLWPFVLIVMGFPFGGIEETPNSIAAAAFIAGAIGMSGMKIITAMVEAKVKDASKPDGD